MNSRQEKLRIAMLGHKRIPSREGGIEVVVEELSSRLAELGMQVTCYNRRGHHISGKEFDTAGLKEYKGVRLKSLCTLDFRGLAAMTSSVWGAVVTAFGPYDVVHFHAEGTCVFLWLPKLLGKRCVVTIHGLDHKRAKWGRLASAYIMAGERAAVRYADEMIVLSEGVKRYFKDTYGRETVLIPNGVTRPYRKEVDVIFRKWGLERDGYILFLGRIVPEKGIQYLIQAFKQVQTDKKLVIAGSASDTNGFVNELKEDAKEDRRILFTGFVQGEPLAELYSNAYVYVLPSDLEGMPLSLLEAMSYGNCCLTSDISECTDVTEEYACSFRRGDPESLRRQLQYLCSNQAEVKWYKDRAADFICGKYSWDKTVQETLRLYRKRKGET